MSQLIPHSDRADFAVQCAVVTLSDTRTEETDTSGQLIRQMLSESGHDIREYLILKDEPDRICAAMEKLCGDGGIDVAIANGGTGIAPRDTTYDAIEGLLEKTLPGFGELFRFLSYSEIGSRAIASRAVAGVCRGTLIFSVPGSRGAVKLAMEKLILPELVHLVKQIRGDK
ncbi:MAG: MogA/MoaB family molybdenum cofactor biosynthesis protein [Limnospira sp.]